MKNYQSESSDDCSEHSIDINIGGQVSEKLNDLTDDKGQQDSLNESEQKVPQIES